MEKRCKNCKYFGDIHIDDEDARLLYGGGVCQHEHFVYGIGDIKENCHIAEHNRTPIDGLLYIDAEGYSVDFYVGPEFGCIHFEPKP